MSFKTSLPVCHVLVFDRTQIPNLRKGNAFCHVSSPANVPKRQGATCFVISLFYCSILLITRRPCLLRMPSIRHNVHEIRIILHIVDVRKDNALARCKRVHLLDNKVDVAVRKELAAVQLHLLDSVV